MSKRLWMIGLGAALGGLVAGFALVLLTPSESTSDATPAASMADVTLSETSDESSQPSPSADVETSSDAESTDSGTLSDQVTACADAASRADAAVEAARTALGNWKTHYGAQIAFDNGEIDSDEAKRRWAESKAPGQDNVDAFVAARQDLPENDPCDGLDVTGFDESARTPTEHCIARTAAVPDVMDAAQPALDGWTGHLEMMATRDEYPIDEYLEIWRQTVADAPGTMQTFEDAADGYDEIGACDPDLAALDG